MPEGLKLFSSSYFLAHLLISFLYILVFFSLIKSAVGKSAINNLFSYLLAFAFFCFAVFFFIEALFTNQVQPWGMKVFSAAMAGLPALTFLLFYRRSVEISEEVARKSSDRFNKLKDEFLSVASHELRTPLSVINGFAEILVREKLGTLNDEQKRRVRKILMQGQRLNRIIDELLDLSRIRSGKVEVRMDVFDIVPVLKACMDDHLIVCEQQNITLHDEIPDILPDVVGDLERVTQVVVNLLNNAIKYTEPGGSVTVSAVHDEVKRELKIEVKDTGIGIDPKDQAKVFDEFYRVNHAYARKFSGSGLGLAIVKQLVEVQNGKVGLTSEGAGKGSTFFFTLPLAKDAKLGDKIQRAPSETLPANPSQFKK
jgi:signal transduction histidine kinase